MAYFNLSSHLYLSRLIYNASLIILLTICTTGLLLLLTSSHAACANIYRTSLLSRYLAVYYLTPQRVSSHTPSYSIGYSHAYIIHPGQLIQSHTLWHILHVLTHTLLQTVISLPYDSLHY
jgi:hypothetical protein